MTNIKTILHPTDFSDQAYSAFQLACALARDYDAKLLLLFVEQPPAVVYGEFGTLPADPDSAEGVYRKQLSKLTPADANIPVERFYIQGEPAPEIVALAEKHDVDLIVMGTHGRGWLGRLLMGSVAEHVVRKASTPVLTVKTPMDESAENTETEKSETADA